MAKQSLLSDKTVVFDTETTGLSPLQGHRIIEIGAVLLQGNDIMDEFHSLIDAGVPIDPRAQAVHGITRKMLHGHPRSAEVFADFRDFIGHALLVAHNAPFDTRFLRAEFDQLGFNLPNRIGCSSKNEQAKAGSSQLPARYGL